MDLPLSNRINIPSIDIAKATKVNVDATQNTTTTYCTEKTEEKQSITFVHFV